MDTFAVDWFFCEPQQRGKLARVVAAHNDEVAQPAFAEPCAVEAQLIRRNKRVQLVRHIALAAMNRHLRNKAHLDLDSRSFVAPSPMPGQGSEIISPVGAVPCLEPCFIGDL